VRKLLVLLILMMPMTVYAETFNELLNSMGEPVSTRFEDGVIVEIDLVNRIIQISGYDYHVSPPFGENVTEISLYGTSFGSFELLSVGMKVQVGYLELGRARVAMMINEIDPNLEVDY
jgi:hypothetical protein